MTLGKKVALIGQDKEEIELSVKVKNIGKVKGKEVVQEYVSDVINAVTTPFKELKEFK